MKTIAILGNIAGFLFIAYLFTDFPRDPDWTEVAVSVGYAILALLNTYLLSRGERKPSRIFRMVGYWMDAKEEELKARAKKAS